MNLLDLFVKIGVKDDASPEVENISGSIISKLAGAAKTAAKALAGMWAAKKVYEFGRAAFDAYSEFEQLEGGIQKLYGNAGMTLEEYAQSVHKSVDEVRAEYERNEQAQAQMLEYAQQGWRTAGMDANTYLQNATGFSAALINSLSGDTVEAARLTDVAMGAISDNVNTFGSDMGSVTSAFMGFARQNYTMLDNLKLGYAGSKEGMEQLIADANAYAASIGEASDLSIDSFADVVRAVELVQEAQGIAGTTQREALSTIQGSISATSSAWANLVAEFGKPEADIGARISDMITAVFGVNGEGGLARNVVKEVAVIGKNLVSGLYTAVTMGLDWARSNGSALMSQAVEVIFSKLSQAGELVSTYAPILRDAFVDVFRTGMEWLASNLPSLATGIVAGIDGLFDMITGTVEGEGPSFIDAFVDLVLELVDVFTDNWPAISEALIEGLGNLVETIGEHGPEMLEAFVGFLTNIVSAIVTYAPIVLANFASLLAGVVASLLQQAPKFLAAAANFIGGLLVSVAEAIPKVLSALVSGIGSLVRGVISGVPGMLAAGREFINGMKNGVTSSFEGVKAFFSGIPGRIRSALGDTASILFNAGSAIISGLLNGIRSAFGGVQSFVSGIGGWIANHKGPLDYDRRLLIPNGKAIMQSLATGLDTGFDKYVESMVSDMGDGIAKSLSGNYEINASMTGTGVSSATKEEPTQNVTYILQIGDIEYNTDKAMQEAIDHWFEVAARRAGQYGIA